MRRFFLLAILGSLLVLPGLYAQEESFGIRNATHPEKGLLFGGQLTPEQVDALAKAGYKRILDLRRPEEDRGFDEADRASAAGIEYRNLVFSQQALEEGELLDEFARLIEDSERPVAVHCASGNRVGGLYYAYLVAKQGLDPAEARQRAESNGLRSAGLRDMIEAFLKPDPE